MTTPSSLKWFTSLPVEQAEVLKLDFAVDLDRVINSHGLSRKAVAERLGSSPAWITKVLRGDVNLTIETMAKLAESVGHVLHFELKPKFEASAATTNVFTFEVFRQAKVKGAREIEFTLPKDQTLSINDPRFADAA